MGILGLFLRPASDFVQRATARNSVIFHPISKKQSTLRLRRPRSIRRAAPSGIQGRSPRKILYFLDYNGENLAIRKP